MKIDGGKSLTSKSTVDWYGSDVMNRRFEVAQGGVSKFKFFWKNMKESLFPSKEGAKAEVGSDEWISATQTSNWASRSEEAHEKVAADYGEYTIDNDKAQEFERANEYGGRNNPARSSVFPGGRRTTGTEFRGYESSRVRFTNM